eukprot:TRINITY_DN13456_c0_g1_i1.p1 TRINITY_DN13456_c0_g1~~TRINITY_DN13456_c0_g1_i1.p1  ORF type:complete len:100 (-),score=3.09 TRINITY_DN13456_c0_g1_i1:13-312(-)
MYPFCSCVTKEPKLRPTTQCHRPRCRFSTARLMAVAKSFSNDTDSKASFAAIMTSSTTSFSMSVLTLLSCWAALAAMGSWGQFNASGRLRVGPDNRDGR